MEPTLTVAGIQTRDGAEEKGLTGTGGAVDKQAGTRGNSEVNVPPHGNHAGKVRNSQHATDSRLKRMTSFKRADGRAQDEMRPIRITRGFTNNPAGSVLVEFGNTRVMCTASVEERIPRFKYGSGEGWLTAEYSMLPAATHERMPRESMKGKVKGRTHEISRLVGRSLRAAIDLRELGENTIAIDCDVLQADGGTRTASITGAYVALADAIAELKRRGVVTGNPLLPPVAAVSVGLIDGHVCLDLPYEEDSRADVDMNVIMTESGEFVEIQGTGEHSTFTREQLNQLLDAAEKGCREIISAQKAVLEGELGGSGGVAGGGTVGGGAAGGGA